MLPTEPGHISPCLGDLWWQLEPPDAPQQSSLWAVVKPPAGVSGLMVMGCSEEHLARYPGPLVPRYVQWGEAASWEKHEDSGKDPSPLPQPEEDRVNVSLLLACSGDKAVLLYFILF